MIIILAICMLITFIVILVSTIYKPPDTSCKTVNLREICCPNPPLTLESL